MLPSKSKERGADPPGVFMSKEKMGKRDLAHESVLRSPLYPSPQPTVLLDANIILQASILRIFEQIDRRDPPGPDLPLHHLSPSEIQHRVKLHHLLKLRLHPLYLILPLENKPYPLVVQVRNHSIVGHQPSLCQIQTLDDL